MTAWVERVKGLKIKTGTHPDQGNKKNKPKKNRQKLYLHGFCTGFLGFCLTLRNA